MRIWKFPLAITDEATLSLPKYARILSVQAQGDALVLWALVDERREARDDWRVFVVGTGNPADHVESAVYVGTVQTHSGSLVWHVFAHKIPTLPS